MSRTVKAYKLNTGEELIGYFESATQDYIVLDKPHVIVPQQREDGKFMIVFAPWLLTVMGEGKAKLYWHAIQGEPVDLPKPFEDGFVKQTSPIVQATPQEKSLILTGR